MRKRTIKNTLTQSIINSPRHGSKISVCEDTDRGGKIKLGAANLNAPVYDLDFFRDSIPNRPMILQPSGITLINQSKPESPTSIFGNKQMIWAAIILVAIVLGYMSVKMIGEKIKYSNK